MSSLDTARGALLSLDPSAERRGAVRLERDGPVAHLVVDHPGARSALTLSMMVELCDAVTALEAWDGSLVVISSTDPRCFCSGGYLDQLVRVIDRPEKAYQMAVAMGTILDRLAELPFISVAALDGPAIGGGAELCTAADFRVAAPEARIHFVHTELGVAPGWGGTHRLVQLVGRSAALRVLANGRAMFPGEGVEIGLVDHRCEGSAVEGALEWLGTLRSRPPEAVRAAKRQLVAALRGDRQDDAAAFASVWGGEAHRAALARLGR